jgi:CRISPR-associated protein Csx14
MLPSHSQILIATLGTEPQVVTLAYDLLRAKGYRLSEVVVLHTAATAIQTALQRLQEHWQRYPSEWVAPLRLLPVLRDQAVITDIVSEADTHTLLQCLYHEVLTHKRARRMVHLCLAGGRKPMSLYAMLVAQLLCDDDDRVWYLLTEGWRPGDAQIMRVRPQDKVELLPIPVLRWSQVSPALTPLALLDDAWDAIHQQKQQRLIADAQHKAEFVERQLTTAERAVVALVVEGMDSKAIARRLGKKEKTVSNQLNKIYDKFRAFLGYRDDVGVDRYVLISELKVYYTLYGSARG